MKLLALCFLLVASAQATTCFGKNRPVTVNIAKFGTFRQTNTCRKGEVLVDHSCTHNGGSLMTATTERFIVRNGNMVGVECRFRNGDESKIAQFFDINVDLHCVPESEVSPTVNTTSESLRLTFIGTGGDTKDLEATCPVGQVAIGAACGRAFSAGQSGPSVADAVISSVDFVRDNTGQPIGAFCTTQLNSRTLLRPPNRIFGLNFDLKTTVQCVNANILSDCQDKTTRCTRSTHNTLVRNIKNSSRRVVKNRCPANQVLLDYKCLSEQHPFSQDKENFATFITSVRNGKTVATGVVCDIFVGNQSGAKTIGQVTLRADIVCVDPDQFNGGVELKETVLRDKVGAKKVRRVFADCPNQNLYGNACNVGGRGSFRLRSEEAQQIIGLESPTFKRCSFKNYALGKRTATMKTSAICASNEPLAKDDCGVSEIFGSND